VTVNDAPVSDAGADIFYCSGGSGLIGAAATAGYTYSWSPAAGLSSTTVSNPTVTLTNTTVNTIIITYTVITSVIGCSSTDTVDVYVYPIPVADFNAPASLCISGNSFTFQAGGSFSSPAIIDWNFGSAATPSSSNSAIPTVTFSAEGDYLVTLTVTQNGCVSNTDSSYITIHPIPIVNFSADTLTGCVIFTVCFKDSSVTNPPATYQWDFGDGGSSTLQNPCHNYIAAGTYSVKLEVTSADGCESHVIIPNLITVIPNPDAIFSAGDNTEFFTDDVIQLENQSRNAVSYFWTFGNGTTSTEENPSVAYADSGIYIITLNAYNQLGCLDTMSFPVVVFEPETFYVPNAFSPNGDGVNDDFRVYGSGFPGFHLLVFNRWGGLVFETTDPNDGWDGTFSGKPVDPGVYVYYINVEFFSGIAPEDYSKFKKGSVTLIR
jgi:gliding motility-associated-like protein